MLLVPARADEMSGMLYLAVPNTILHEVDAWSPLLPPRVAADRRRQQRQRNAFDPAGGGLGASFGSFTSYPMPPQRAIDREVGGNTGCACAACGETFETLEVLRHHIRYSLVEDRLSGHDICTQCKVCG